MKFRLYNLIGLMACAACLCAQNTIGSWRSHVAYSDVQEAVSGGDKVYVRADGALYSYDTEDETLTTYSKISGLSDQNITHLCYVPQTQCLLIVYKNGNIDLLYANERIHNLPDYYNKTLAQDKTINAVSRCGDVVYLCTNFGLIAINTRTSRFGNTYMLGQKTYSCTLANNDLYVATEAGLYLGRSGDNLLETANWQKLNNAVLTSIFFFDNTLIGFQQGNGVFSFAQSTGEATQLFTGRYHIATLDGNQLVATNRYQAVFFTAANSWKSFTLPQTVNNLFYRKGQYVATLSTPELAFYKWNETTSSLQEELRVPPPDGLRRPLAAAMQVDNDRLLVSGGGIYLDRFNNQGTIMQYKSGRWTAFQDTGIEEETGLEYKDIVQVAVSPTDTAVVYATSGGEGLYAFRNGRFEMLYNQSNSTLRSVLNESPRFVRIGALAHDTYGNLWVMNMEVSTVVNILRTDGTWIRPEYAEIANWSPRQMLFDSRGRVWISSMKHPGGLCCITLGNNLTSTADDRILARTSFVNQDGITVGGGAQPRVFALAEDKEGLIWVGTIRGLLVVSNPSRWYNDDFRFTQVKIPRNDGTGLADYLLAGERINAIAIDGGNRKWFGTQENGLYLMDADNVTQLRHFTIDNSPLPSNNIQSIAIMPSTGEVFIGTDAGIVSYQSDATEAEPVFASDVHAFPNPVRSDYTGPITIKGLVYDSDVKIVDTSGRLVRKGRSTGGMYSWDGCNEEGTRVAAGIYMVLAANADGSESVATKIMIIR